MRSHLEDGSVEPEGSTDIGDVYQPDSIECYACGWSLPEEEPEQKEEADHA